MLVLSRKKNEVIRIGENITIKVVEMKGGQVKLGIEAPRHVSVVRDELFETDSPDDGEDRTPCVPQSKDARPAGRRRVERVTA